MIQRIAVVVTTYEWPSALRAVLQSLADQQCRGFEVIVADDGSSASTAAVIAEFVRCAAFTLHHVWQEDRGFRAAAARNRGVAATDAEYIVFLDGDCVVRPDFLERHAQLAEPGFFVRGNRVTLSEALTTAVLGANIAIHRWGIVRWLGQWRRGRVNQVLPFLRLPLGPLRKLTPRRFEGVRTCNLGVWRRDYVAINGLDEAYQGWGFEDWDLAVRLMNSGIYRKEGRFAIPVLHLWHESREDYEVNRGRFEHHLAAGATWAERGVDQYGNLLRGGGWDTSE